MYRLALVCSALSAGACNVALDTPAGTRVLCAEDTDCPDGHCSASVAVCIAADDDDAPPRIVSAESLDEHHVAVVFSRAVDALQARDFSIYAFGGGLTPSDAVVAVDDLSVTVETSLQKQRTYALTVVDLTDPFGRPVDAAPAYFTGIGVPPSGRTPTALAPIDHELFTDPAVTFRWSSLDDAVFYTLEVATDADFAYPIAESPFTGEAVEVTLTLASDATYYWRVTADISSETPEVQAFVVFGDAVNVYCASDADCGATPAWDAGTRSHPLRRITRALSLASYLSRSEVRIAGRGGGNFYDEALVVSDPVTRVLGSFDMQFSTVDMLAHPTVLRGLPNALRLVSSSALELSDLELRGEGNVALLLDGR